MRYQVPQFIEVEDKIVGQLTLKQFIYIAGGTGLSFILYRFVNLYLSAIPIILIMAFSIALAFYRPNEKQTFIQLVEAAFKYYTSARLFIWKKVPAKKSTKPAQEAKEYAGIMVPKMSDSKLKDLTWSLDIKESVYSNRNQK